MSYYGLQARAPEPKTKKAAPRFAPPCDRNPLWQGLSAGLAIMSLYQIHYSNFGQHAAYGSGGPSAQRLYGHGRRIRRRSGDLRPRSELIPSQHRGLFPRSGVSTCFWQFLVWNAEISPKNKAFSPINILLKNNLSNNWNNPIWGPNMTENRPI